MSPRSGEQGESGRQSVGDWRNRAACLTSDPELFFPVGSVTSGPGLEQQNRAKEVCARCTVDAACLHYALETGQDTGVWGGLGEDERRELKRRAIRQRRRDIGRGAINTSQSVY